MTEPRADYDSPWKEALADEVIFMPAIDLIKPEVRAVAAYHLRDFRPPIKLNQNENPFGFPEPLKAEVWRRVNQVDWARYPDFYLREITDRLAAHVGVPPEWVLPGNGSNELLQMTLLAALAPGTAAVVPVPSFSLYRIQSLVMGAEFAPIQLRSEDGFALPVDAVIAEAKEHRAKVIILCSPNNPTGNTYPEADVRRVVAESGALVLLDEAYREFSDQDFLPVLRDHENVVIFRTFSKAFAMGGLRVGYLIGRPDIVREIGKVKLPYGLNIMSEAVALVALDHLPIFQEQIRAIRALREALYADLRALPGTHPYPSAANFILTHFDRPVAEVFDHLLADGILIRDVSNYPGLSGHIRISVGTTEENAALVESLKKLNVKRQT